MSRGSGGEQASLLRLLLLLLLLFLFSAELPVYRVLSGDAFGLDGHARPQSPKVADDGQNLDLVVADPDLPIAFAARAAKPGALRGCDLRAGAAIPRIPNPNQFELGLAVATGYYA